MSDDDNKLPDLGDLDWDSALDEWEKNTFVPQLAKDTKDGEAVKADPSPSGNGPAAGAAQGSLRDVSGEGTVIAPVPRELRNETGPPQPARPSLPAPRASMPSITAPPPRAPARGGLGQLFSKAPAATSARPPAPTPPPPRARPSMPAIEPDPAALESTGESEIAALGIPGALSGLSRVSSSDNVSSVTKQLVMPGALPPEAYADSDPAPTLVGRGLLDAEDTTRRRDRPDSISQANTVAARDLADVETTTTLGDRSIFDIDDNIETKAAVSQSQVPAEPERPQMGSLSDAETATRHPGDVAPNEPSPADDEPPTAYRRSAPAPAPAEIEPAPETAILQEPTRWLDAAQTTSYKQRALWLEEEARAIVDATERARALLGVSELLAIVEDRAGAQLLANEARELAPSIALTWRQARQLLPRDIDGEARISALDAESASSPTPAARAHATLLAADELRLAGDGEGAFKRWSSAAKLDPADVRAPAARAALALSNHQHSGAGSDLAENSELLALDKAMGIILKLRGAPRPGTDVDSMPVNDALRRARLALLASDVVGAAQAFAEVASEPALAKAALWLSAAYGAQHIAGRRASAKALKTLTNDGEALARRSLAARGIELGDPELVTTALSGDDEAVIDAPERAVLQALAGQDPAPSVDALADSEELAALLDALSALEVPADEGVAIKRSRLTSGKEERRALGTLGRLLAARPSTAAVDLGVSAVAQPRPPSAAGVALEVAVTTARWDEVADSLSALPTSDETSAAQRHIAAAIVAERAGNAVTARRAWREALEHGAKHESVLRAVASLDNQIDLAGELLRIADDQPDGLAPAVLRLESLSRREGDEAERDALLDRIHKGAPTLGIAAFLAERVARKKGDVDEVLRWISERRAFTNDSLETALDNVREALLVADRDPDLASTRLEEAHRARPDDVALRELYERLATDAPTDRGAFRRRRAEKATGAARALLFTEASIELERAGDLEGALETAREAKAAGDTGLSLPMLERAQIATGHTESLTSDLMTIARETEEVGLRRRTYERLAELDHKDEAAALMWHKTILEETPVHLPSLRHVEHALIGQGRDGELEGIFEQIAHALDGTSGGEVAGHAQLATRLKTRVPGGWESTGEMAKLAATQKEPSLWALRALNAHARVQKDESAILSTTVALLERTQRPPERSALLLRASEAAARLEQVDDARAFLEQAANEDPGDVVTWGFLAEVRERGGETRAAAEACESLARTSSVPSHQLLAWYDAARIWLDEVKDSERGMTALEHCAEIDVTHGDVFTRLSSLYAERRLDAELARLLEKRLAIVTDEGERVALQVELSRALADMGELAKAKQSLEGALEHQPNHTTALGAMAELCAREGDWQGAEQAYVRLARLLSTPSEQRAIYEKLGEIYGTHTGNLSRAEVAYREVLKRAPGDLPTLQKLVELYKRQGDLERAVETQGQIVAESKDPAERLSRLIELAGIHETVSRDVRRAEQVLESARKEFPTSVVALRAMAEFYQRQRQMPAMQILLDRAASDARRSFAAGRFIPALFEVLHLAYDLRGKKDASRVVAATLAAVEGQKADIVGGDARAVDPRLDDLLAPEIINPALRALMARAGDSLDAIAPLDLRALRAAPLQPGTPLGTSIGAVATVVGLGALQILVSPTLGRVALPLGTNPPALLVGEAFMNVPNERARTFVIVRALKVILARCSSLLRPEVAEVPVLVSAVFTAFNPSFTPQGVDARRVADVSRRLVPALPRNLDPTVGVIALEAAGTVGANAPHLGEAGHAWANRVALLAVGDPNAALDAIAWSQGEEAAPQDPEQRAAWIARTPEARELMTFSVTDGYAEARMRLGLDR